MSTDKLRHRLHGHIGPERQRTLFTIVFRRRIGLSLCEYALPETLVRIGSVPFAERLTRRTRLCTDRG